MILPAIVVLAGYCTSVEALEYRAVTLPTLEGYSQSQALGVNDSGQVVGFSYNTDSSNYEACLWENGQVRSLGKPFGMTASIATCINNKGEIAGESYNSVDSRGCKWVGGDAVDISVGGLFRTVCGMNENGWVVGAADNPATGANQSCVYKDGGLTYIPSYWAPSRGVNNNGQVVGDGNGVGSGVYDAFLWQDGVMTPLGILPGCNNSAALAINDSGQIVGGSGISGGTAEYAVLWQNGSMTALPSAGGYNYAWANSISKWGRIAGVSFNQHTAYQATSWQDGRAFDLGPGMAWAINGNGLIAGYTYSVTGAEQAVLWQPVPEPSGYITFAIGIIGLGNALRRRRS